MSNFSDNLSLEQCLLSQAQSNNPLIMDIESKILNRATTDSTYHRYQVDTKIASAGNKFATVENVFHMLKEHASLQAITPYDFPDEVLGDVFLTEINNTHVKIFEDLANAQTERISSLQAIMDMDPIFNGLDISENSLKVGAGVKFSGAPFRKYNRDLLYSYQVALNPVKSIHETQEYKLFNFSETAHVRALFKTAYWIFIKFPQNCEGGNIENPLFDPVIMHIDDTNYTIVNYTKEGHYFHPGKITRTVLRNSETGDIYLRTIGEGLHFCKGLQGAFSGRLNTIMGMSLFKNTDLRLKKAFDELTTN